MLNALLLVDESAIYGGHEAMFMAFLKSMLPDLKRNFVVHFIVNRENEKLIEQLRHIDYEGVVIHRLEFSRLLIKPISGFMWPVDYFKLKRVIAQIRPASVLNIQGTIEIGCTTLRVCQSLKVEILSYLPITKSSKAMGVFLGWVRDLVCKYFYYSIPKTIITISQTNSDELKNVFEVPPSRIAIVKNFVEPAEQVPVNTLPDFASGKKHLALIGRISNVQKRQFDFLSRWLKRPESADYAVHVVGNSSDKESRQLYELCYAATLDGRVHFHGWQSSGYVTEVIKHCDALVLPSRFEGVPLVMIEAVQLGCLVVASAVDGMKEFLPSELLFDVDDWQAMFNIINKLECSGLRAKLLTQSQSHFEVFNKKQNTNNFLEHLNNELIKA